MRLRFYFLPFFALMLLATFSCEKDQVQIPVAEPLTAEEYLAKVETPDILFHYEEINVLTDENRGWVIDNSGNLRTYENVFSTLKVENSKAEIANFLRSTQLVQAVDLDALVGYYKNNRAISNSAISENALAQSSDWEVSYYGIAMETSYSNADKNSGAGCGFGNCEDQSSKEEQKQVIEQILLESLGSLHLVREDERAQAVLAWLKSLNVDLN